MKKIVKLMGVALLLGMFSGCGLIDDLADDPTPTETLMKEGMWKVTAVYDDANPGVNIVDTLQLGFAGTKVPFVFNMKDMDELTCTGGPLFLYLVYGRSNWTEFMGKMDQVFNYIDGEAVTTGEWGIGDGVVSKFTIELKLQPPGLNSMLSAINKILGLDALTQKIDKYVIHKFYDVDVTLEGSKMIWELTDETRGKYFTQNQYLDDVEWIQVNPQNFSRCRIVFEKWSGAEATKLFERLQ